MNLTQLFLKNIPKNFNQENIQQLFLDIGVNGIQVVSLHNDKKGTQTAVI